MTRVLELSSLFSLLGNIATVNIDMHLIKSVIGMLHTFYGIFYESRFFFYK